MAFSGKSPASFKTSGMRPYDGGSGPDTNSGDTHAQALEKTRDNFVALDSAVDDTKATISSLQARIAELESAATPSLHTDVDPTTLEFDGLHKIYAGSIYYWAALNYKLVESASQIDINLNESWVYALNVSYRRGLNRVWEAVEAKPSAPLNVQTQQAANGEMGATWAEPATDGGSPITGYIRRVAGQDDEDIGLPNPLADTFTVTSGQIGVVQYLAYNLVGTGDPSEAATFVADAATVPSKMADLVLTPTPLSMDIALQIPNANGSTIENIVIEVEPL